MKRMFILMLIVVFSGSIGALAQLDDEGNIFEEEKDLREDLSEAEAEAKAKKAEEEKARLEAQKRADEAKRESIRKNNLARKKAADRAQELNSMREAAADSTVYTLKPDSVELVVEMDPNNYGFRTRNHRMILSGDFDLLFRGRAMIGYDFRFFEYFSFGAHVGVDWSSLSLYSRFRDYLSKPAPSQFSVLGGLTAKWRLTEWYMRSAIFLEPSVLFGHMWQTYVAQDYTSWRIRPGIFGGVDTVFDSGFALSWRLGAEFPVDFGEPNPIKEVVEPLFMIGFGFAI